MSGGLRFRYSAILAGKGALPGVSLSVMKALAVIILLVWAVQSAEIKPAGVGGHFKGPLGLQMYSLRHLSATNQTLALDKTRAFGFPTIEGAAGRLAPEEFLQTLAARDLKIVSTFADYARLKTNIDGVIASAQRLGVKYVVCGWIPHQKSNFSEKNAREAAEIFNAAGGALKKAGLTFAYHIHGYEFQPFQDGTLFDLLMAETRPDAVSIELDVFWAAQGGADPTALIDRYGSRVRLMHVKDLRKGAAINHSGGAPDSDSVPVGQGSINWPSVLRAAQKAGVEHYFIEDEAVEAIDQIPLSLRYLEKVSW